MATPLSAKALGSLVKLKENGVAQEFYVCQHGYPTAGSGRTLLVRRRNYDDRQWHSSNVNALATSTIDAWLNGAYLGLLAADIQAQIAAVNIRYTPGNNNNTVGDLSRKVFLLSVTELGQTASYANVEGTALTTTVVDLLKIATDSAGTAKTQWTRSPNTNSATYVCRLNSVGGVNYNYASDTSGARPALTLPSSLSVDDGTGEVVVNTPPAINYSGSTALGNQTAGFTVTYSVSDADNDPVTVTEKLNGTVRRTHSPALGSNQQFQAVLPQNFQTILNGNHTLTIEATDGKAAATPVNITFSKTVYNASITLSAPLPADDMPTAIRLSITGSIPADAVWTAQVCNNGNDASPTWENIKPAMEGGYNYMFSNTSKTAASWGINFKITMQRGPSNTGGHISAIEGGYQ